mgnify:FL=1
MNYSQIEIEKKVFSAQKSWADYIIKIGEFKSDNRKIIELVNQLIEDLYAFKTTKVLFKPTKARVIPFRSTKEEFISYFIASNNACTEDKGFALEPWKSIEFENYGITNSEQSITAVGNYFFENSNSQKIKVEYTFGYIIDETGKLKINLHHSSIPFK